MQKQSGNSPLSLQLNARPVGPRGSHDPAVVAGTTCKQLFIAPVSSVGRALTNDPRKSLGPTRIECHSEPPAGDRIQGEFVSSEFSSCFLVSMCVKLQHQVDKQFVLDGNPWNEIWGVLIMGGHSWAGI